ncbi:MAG: peroxiredoxin, partial [Alphaproteobacteria bacterium]
MTKANDLLGKTAPEFSAPANAGKTISLSDYRGKKVILYFYPKDMTPGCTTQAKDFTCLNSQFADKNCVIIGVSKDSPERHDKFIAKHNMPYDLISDDEDATICKQFGVWQPKKFMGKEFLGIVRSTFIIDE